MIMGEIVIEHCVSCCEKKNQLAEDDTKVENNIGDCAESAKTGSSISDQPDHGEPAASQSANQIQGVAGAAQAISTCASKLVHGVTPPRRQLKGRSFCNQCTRFLQARIVKNANGTDMSLQREALKARRAYMSERKRQMECLMSNVKGTTIIAQSIGCGPPI